MYFEENSAGEGGEYVSENEGIEDERSRQPSPPPFSEGEKDSNCDSIGEETGGNDGRIQTGSHTIHQKEEMQAPSSAVKGEELPEMIIILDSESEGESTRRKRRRRIDAEVDGEEASEHDKRGLSRHQKRQKGERTSASGKGNPHTRRTRSEEKEEEEDIERVGSGRWSPEKQRKTRGRGRPRKPTPGQSHHDGMTVSKRGRRNRGLISDGRHSSRIDEADSKRRSESPAEKERKTSEGSERRASPAPQKQAKSAPQKKKLWSERKEVQERTSSKGSKSTVSMSKKRKKGSADNGNGESVYEVEKVLSHRLRTINGREKLQYLIKWKGFDRILSTWEPLEHLDCAEVLEAYWRDQAARPHPKSSSPQLATRRTRSRR